MFPRQPGVATSPVLPAAASFYVPADEEWDDESGFGSFFQDVWAIRDIPHSDAVFMIERERALAYAVAAGVVDEDAFDRAAEAVEGSDLEELGELVITHPGLAPLLKLVDDIPVLDGLELGVAGLVYALSSVGAYPASSCRGNGWASHPVVYVAIDRWRAEALSLLMARARCGYSIDPERSELLVIQAASIEDTMALASLIVKSRHLFEVEAGRGSSVVQDRLPGL